jgi:transposase-like protein
VKKGQSRLSGLDEKIIALYARCLSVRDIHAQLQEMYVVEVSPTLISNVTDAVIDEVKQWQNRPLNYGLSNRISGLSSHQSPRQWTSDQ